MSLADFFLDSQKAFLMKRYPRRSFGGNPDETSGETPEVTVEGTYQGTFSGLVKGNHDKIS